jgi:hypothetical protein
MNDPNVNVSSGDDTAAYPLDQDLPDAHTTAYLPQTLLHGLRLIAEYYLNADTS